MITRHTTVRIKYVVALLLLVNCAGGDEFETLRNRINHRLKQDQVPSLAVAVAKNGKIIWEEGFGWANREDRRRATAHTMYSLASISKPITATGLMLLVDRKAVDLDTAANKYLGKAKLEAMVGKVDEATVRRLANHTSGLPLHYQFFYADEPHPRPAMDESIRRYGKLMTDPGETYQYANFGYGLLDYLIERNSGKSYAEFMRTEVFLPLGMTHTSVGIEKALENHQAIRYDTNQKPLPLYTFDHPGASAVYSSAHDLALFGMFHIGDLQKDQKAIIDESSRKQMQKPTADLGGDVGYGIGWRVAKSEFGYRTVSHTGGMPGVRTKLVLVPEEGIVVATLANYRSSLPHLISRDIIGQLLPKYRKNREAALRKGTERKAPAEFRPAASLVGYWEGQLRTYETTLPLKMWLRKSGEIHIQLADQLKTLVNRPSLRDAFLRGVFQGDVATSDSNRRKYHLHLKLKHRNDILNGSASAVATSPRGNAQSYWVELKKKSPLAQPLSLFDGKTLKNWEIISKNVFDKHGKVDVKAGQITLDKGYPASGIRWTGKVPQTNYQIELEAQRMAGEDFFCGLTFPVGKSHCTMICGGWGGGTVGLSNIDGMTADENDTTNYTEFKNGRWYKIRIQVLDDRIEGWIDGERILSTKRKGHKFSIWWEQEPARSLGIATWNTKAAIRNIRLLPPEN